MRTGNQKHALLDYLWVKFGIKSDRQLANQLSMNAPAISKIRNRRLPVSDSVILALHEEFDIPVKVIRELIAKSKIEGEENASSQENSISPAPTANVSGGEALES